MTKVKPVGKRLLLQIPEVTETIVSGIIVPTKETPRFIKAKVIAIANDVVDMHVGSHILIDKYTAAEVIIDDEKLWLMKETDVLAIFK